MKTTSIFADVKAQKDLSDKIKELLISSTNFRDNDALLINRIQRDEIVKIRSINEMNLNDFFQMRIDGLVSSEHDIVTLRKEIQEQFPETQAQIENIDTEHFVENIDAEFFAKEEDDFCEHCQGTKIYESFPCNVCCGDDKTPKTV